VTDEASVFKFGAQLGFGKAHHQILLEQKVGVALDYESSPNLGASF